MLNVVRLWAMAALIVGSALSVSASSAPAVQAATCDVQIGYTYQSGSYIVGYGSISNCSSGAQATLTIQRSRWWGWEDMATATVYGPGYDQYVYYYCANTGTHEFRTTISGQEVGGGYKFKESNHITVSC